MTDTQHYRSASMARCFSWRDKWGRLHNPPGALLRATHDINTLCDRIDALEAENADLRAIWLPGWGSEQLTADDNYYADPAPRPIPADPDHSEFEAAFAWCVIRYRKLLDMLRRR
jgi:hypothetical protein